MKNTFSFSAILLALFLLGFSCNLPREEIEINLVSRTIETDSTQTLTYEWDRIEIASNYIFRFGINKKPIVVEFVDGKTNSYTVENAPVTDGDEIFAEVEALIVKSVSSGQTTSRAKICNPPQNLQISEFTPSLTSDSATVTIDWDDSPEADGYRLQGFVNGIKVVNEDVSGPNFTTTLGVICEDEIRFLLSSKCDLTSSINAETSCIIITDDIVYIGPPVGDPGGSIVQEICDLDVACEYAAFSTNRIKIFSTEYEIENSNVNKAYLISELQACFCDSESARTITVPLDLDTHCDIPERCVIICPIGEEERQCHTKTKSEESEPTGEERDKP
ncbi:MAG: hypothetical protein AAFP19_08990 [Bacteroidota bacterium]